MSQPINMTGMVLFTAPSGDYDRRVILLTKECGKITAFARGARRPTHPLLSAAVPFNFGSFQLYEGRNAYTLASAHIDQYFGELKTDLEGSFFGSYFMELAGYYGRENLDASDMLNLLYVSLKALINPRIPNVLVRYIYEIRLMVINGEFPQDAADTEGLLDSAKYALHHIITSDLRSLYTFTVSDEVMAQIIALQDPIRRRTIDMKLKSLQILEEIAGAG